MRARGNEGAVLIKQTFTPHDHVHFRVRCVQELALQFRGNRRQAIDLAEFQLVPLHAGGRLYRLSLHERRQSEDRHKNTLGRALARKNIRDNICPPTGTKPAIWRSG